MEMDENRMEEILARLKQMLGDSLLNGMENRQPERHSNEIFRFLQAGRGLFCDIE